MKDEQYTPTHVVEAVRRVLGGIDLDPASCEVANAVVRATNIWTMSSNGLINPWEGRVFCNPPYSRVAPWVDRFVDAYGIMLVNADTSAIWFHKLMDRCDAVCLTRGRLAFRLPDGTVRGQNRMGQAIFLRGACWLHPFAQEFAGIGRVMVL
jgi:ParB family chromosome partitioning protein